MLFDWDDRKSDRNLRDRGFDFEFAVHVFEGETEEFVDDRKRYGEVRIIAFGLVKATMYAVIYTQRSDIRWIISAFRVRAKELKRWKRRAAAR